jgi:hypothetical protein
MRAHKGEAAYTTAISLQRERDRALALYQEAVEAAQQAGSSSDLTRLNAAVVITGRLVGRTNQKWRRYKSGSR